MCGIRRVTCGKERFLRTPIARVSKLNALTKARMFLENPALASVWQEGIHLMRGWTDSGTSLSSPSARKEGVCPDYVLYTSPSLLTS